MSDKGPSQGRFSRDEIRASSEFVRLYAELEAAYEATLEGWIRALDLRDRETEGHSRRVTELTVGMASAYGIEGLELKNLRRGALLHDIGKMALPDRILLKPGPLDEGETREMQRHPEYAHLMLSGIPFLRESLDIPHAHHERWDGLGYPRGLKGDEIPLGARLFAVVDVWDALRHDRPYRAGWPAGQVIEHIQGLTGTHFHPEAVTALEEELRKRGEI
jgi:putative nucleotidyltransferase with HDIG domain